VLDQIVEAANLGPRDRVLEVGPGQGALTERLLASPAAAVHAVELDRDLVGGLRQRFAEEPRFSLTEGDILRAPLTLPHAQPATKVVANIPYNITGPLLERLVGRLDEPATPPYQRLVLMVQEEVAERIQAGAGDQNRGALSVRMQLLGYCRILCRVPPRAFAPPPKVGSAVLVVDPVPADQQLQPALARSVEALLGGTFLHRRKMLRGSLCRLRPVPDLEAVAAAAGVSLQQRPQDLPAQSWVALAKALDSVDTR